MLPDYWIERPSLTLDDATRSAIDEFLSQPEDRQLEIDTVVRRDGDVSLWEFLCGVAARREIAFHGTGDPNIELFEPRKPIDFAPFGDQKAVFATSDPIWAMFYAVVDRARFPITLANGCIMLRDSEDRFGSPHYFFSISRDALALQPWRTGHLYFLPAETFVEQPPDTFAGQAARVPQLASPTAVAPVARLAVTPDDFPFLPNIRGHDDERLAEYAQAVMTAAPWPE